MSVLVSKMSENVEKCRSVFPKPQDEVLKGLVLFKTQTYSLYCHRGEKKQENIHFKVAGIRAFTSFLEKLLKLINRFSK